MIQRVLTSCSLHTEQGVYYITLLQQYVNIILYCVILYYINMMLYIIV